MSETSSPSSDYLKKNRDNRFIQNWKSISLLNVDFKIISKALSEKLKNVLPDLISSQQTTILKTEILVNAGDQYPML